MFYCDGASAHMPVHNYASVMSAVFSPGSRLWSKRAILKKPGAFEVSAPVFFSLHQM